MPGCRVQGRGDTVTPEDTRTDPDRLRHTLHHLCLDWLLLHTTLPHPPRGARTRTSNVRCYGHPAEWASDMAATIAAILTSWHDLLAEHRSETPPPKAPNEQIRILAAWKYLEPRCHQLCQIVDSEALDELPALHNHIRTVLQLNPARYLLPIPCPGCELRTLSRETGAGRDLIMCGNCGWHCTDSHYGWLIHMTLDAVNTAAV
jgi:hypothetical protein